MKSLLSIIVPVHNVEKYLDQCLDSLSGVQIPEMTIFLMENASTDESLSICNCWAQKDSRFKVFHLDEPGVSNARNKALDLCDSEFVTFIDADDFVDSKVFQRAFECCQSKNPDLFFLPYIRYAEGRQELVPLNLKKSEYRNDEIFSDIVQNRLAPGIKFLGCVWRVFFRRDVIGHLQFNKQMSYQEDVAFLIQCALKAKYIFVNEEVAYYNYRINEGSANANPKVNHSERRLDLIREIQNIAKCTGLDFDFAISQRMVSYYSKRCREVALCSGMVNRARAIIEIHRNLDVKYILQCDGNAFGKAFSIYVSLRKKGFRRLSLVLILARYLFF